MIDFTYSWPTVMFFGKDGVGKLSHALGGKYRHALLIHSGGSVVQSGLLQKITSELDGEHVAWTSFDRVRPNPRLGMVQEGIKAAEAGGCDILLAIGGGSSIDTAKAISLGCACGPDALWNDCFIAFKEVQATLPIGVVLTIPASGSETSNACVVTNEKTGEKLTACQESVIPRFAILDPTLTLSLPPYQTACGVCDILAHMMERYFTSDTCTELSDALLEAGMRHIIQMGRMVKAHPDSYDVRADIMWTGSIAHNPLFDRGTSGGDWATHMIEHALSGRYDISHGAGLSALFPAWMQYVSRFKPEKILRFSQNVMGVGNQDDVIGSGISRLVAFYRMLGLPVTLKEAGIPNDCFDAISKEVTGGMYPLGNLMQLSRQDVAAILDLAYGA